MSVKLSATHVYAIQDRFGEEPGDVPGEWPLVHHDHPEVGDRLEVTMGDVPPWVEPQRRMGLAQVSAMLRGYRCDDGARDPDRAISEMLDRLDSDPPYTDAGYWMTIRLSRSVDPADALLTRSDSFPWLETAFFLECTDQFASESQPVLEVASALALSAVPGTAKRIYESRICVETAGKHPLFGLQVRVGGVSIVATHAPEAFPLEPLRAAIDLLPRLGPVESKIAHWLVAFGTENDPWKRFIWSMTGLEYLASKVTSKSKEWLLNSLVMRNPDSEGDTSLDGVASELVWPENSEGKRLDDRSTVFCFAVMCLVLSPGTAGSDIAAFKDLWKVRNDLSHGRLRTDEDVPVGEAMAMFRRFGNLYLLRPRPADE